MKYGRKDRVVVNDPQVYCGEWYAWWKHINPSWRTEDGDTLAMTGEGDWSSMFVPGTNGFLTVFGGLLGVRDAYKDDGKWAAAVSDVRWTVGRVLAAKQALLEATRCVLAWFNVSVA